MIRDRLRALVREHPQRVAIADAEHALTFAELLGQIEALLLRLPARALVVSVLPSGPAFTTAQLAALEAGAMFLPLPHKAPAPELRRVLDGLPPDCVLCDATSASAVREALGVQRPRWLVSAGGAWTEEAGEPARHEPVHTWLPAQTALVQLTSGSTSMPKAVLLSVANLEASLAQSAPFLEGFADEAVFSPVPQFHAMGGALVLEHLLHGSSVLVANRFVPGDDLKRMRAAGVRLVGSSPSYFRIALRLGLLTQLETLRALVIGSAASDPALIAGLRTACPELSLHLRYGLSEAFGALTRLDLEPDAPLPPQGLVGRALPDVELAPLPAPTCEEAAEVRAKSGAVALGQVREPGRWEPMVDAEGFLATGDMGFLDEAGLHLRGRRSTFLKRHGYRIDPSEIEQALVAHPEVREAVVVGLPDVLAGSKIVAVVESAQDAQALDAHCRALLSDTKVPQRIVVMEHLPRTPSGKPDRSRILEALGEGGQK